MKRLLKILGWSFGALLLLIVVAVIAIPFIVDPNDYRDEIAAQVKKRTGRDLTLTGDLKLSIFPWLGVELGETQLSNARGFGPAPFARFDRAEVKVKLLPLLRRQVELDTIELANLRLQLERAHDGRTNWDDLTQAAKQEEKKPAGPAEKDGLAGLTIGGIKITDAQVVWHDKQQGREAEIANLNLSTGAVDLRSPVTLSLDTDFTLSSPQAMGNLSLKGTLLQDLEAERYGFENLKLVLDVRGKAVPGGKLKLHLSGDGRADLKAQTAELKEARLEALGAQLDLNLAARQILDKPAAKGTLRLEIKDGAALVTPVAASLPKGLAPSSLNGATLESAFDADLAADRATIKNINVHALGLALTAEAQGSHLQSKPSFTGKLTLNEFVPRDVAEKLGITLPPMADPTTLSKAHLVTSFDVGTDHAAVKNLVLRLDQSTVKGSAAVPRFAPLALRYDLTLDQLDADRYLPPPSKEKPAAATRTATAPLKLPLRELRALDIDGTLRIASLKAANMRSTDIQTTLRAKGGLLRLHPVSAKLYQGSYAGNLALDARGDTPTLSMDEHLSGIQVGPLLKDFMGKDYVTGKAQLNAKLTARGVDAMQIRRSLTGNGAFVFEDGSVNGMNVGQLLREGYARYKGQPAPKEEARKTDFADLRGTVTVKEGLVTNKDLKAQAPLFNISGQGTAHLATEKVDYRINASVVSNFDDREAPELAPLKGFTVPVRITGTFGEPKFSVDVGAVLEGKARQALEAERKKQEEKLRKDLEKELEKKLKGLLK